MITHFAELQLNTVSIQSVRQFYHEILKLPIVHETDNEIQFRPTEHCMLSFKENSVPLTPTHFAFEVPYSEFDHVLDYLRKERILLLTWPDGREVDTFGPGKNVYFRDGDGNLLEIITHHYVTEGVLPAQGELKILYLREVGFPVKRVASFREWLIRVLDLKPDKVSDNFSFAIGGTAHMVVVSTQRKWIPISMVALPPMMNVAFGVADSSYLQKVRSGLEQDEMIYESETELHFEKCGYRLCLRVTSFNKDIPALLNLPYARWLV